MNVTARSRTTDRRYYGVAEGIVTDVNDPAKEGMVKVKFPWFDEEMVSEWCRVCQVYAGNGYGTFFVPEVGDEILVAFVHGDMRLPIVLGGLYNGQDKPPSWRDGKNKDQKMIRTKGEHEILLDDSVNDLRVRITTKGGHTADFSDQDKKITIETTTGHLVELDDNGKTVTVRSSGGQEVVLDDNATSVTIKTTGGQSIALDGAGAITLKAVASIVLEAPQVKLGGSGAPYSLVLGEPFLTLFNSHVHVPGLPTTSPPVPPIPPGPPALSVVTKTM